MLFSFLTWWYGPGWLAAIRDIQKRPVEVGRSFSLAIIARTLFAPWKRITTQAEAGLDAKMRAMVDNLMSRLVGFTIRLMVLFSATLLMGATLVFFSVVALVWPLLPVAIILCIAKAVV